MNRITLSAIFILICGCQALGRYTSTNKIRSDCNIPSMASAIEVGHHTLGEANEWYGKFRIASEDSSRFEAWAKKNDWQPLPIPEEIMSKFVGYGGQKGRKYSLAERQGLFFCRSKTADLQKSTDCRVTDSWTSQEIKFKGKKHVYPPSFHYMIVAVYDRDSGTIYAISRDTHS